MKDVGLFNEQILVYMGKNNRSVSYKKPEFKTL